MSQRPESMHGFPVLSEEERRASRLAAMEQAPATDAVWVFAYGSLMWNPCFEPAEAMPADLDGYRRRFNFWTVVARGTPECPGLGLGLEAAEGHCRGMLYRLHDDRLEAELDALWAREMYSGVYVPTWIRPRTETGERDALTFIVDPAHPQYAQGLTLDEQAHFIARAQGRYGSCREYLASVIRELAALGVREPELERLRDLVLECTDD